MAAARKHFFRFRFRGDDQWATGARDLKFGKPTEIKSQILQHTVCLCKYSHLVCKSSINYGDDAAF
jgi:hypothetical protein